MSKFTQQHYVATADHVGVAFARAHQQGADCAKVLRGVRLVNEELILMFKLDNPKFSESKYRAAIGQVSVSYRNARGW